MQQGLAALRVERAACCVEQWPGLHIVLCTEDAIRSDMYVTVYDAPMCKQGASMQQVENMAYLEGLLPGSTGCLLLCSRVHSLLDGSLTSLAVGQLSF